MKTIPRGFHHDYMGLDKASIKHSMRNRLIYSIGKNPFQANLRDWYLSMALAVRERLIERWIETMRSYDNANSKRVYYLSLEFLIGRTLQNSVQNLQILDECKKVLLEFGLDLEELRRMEPDAALGNGGLGRLAACFLDSLATLRIPGFGYGIRYEYGMFTQKIEDGHQVEHPDSWLRYRNPWEYPRPEVLYPVQFYGDVVQYKDEQGRLRFQWANSEEVMAMAYDVLIPAYGSNTVNHMRLWTAKASRDFGLQYFNEGNYIKAVEEQTASENLSRVLYPDDTTSMGRELRLKQEYFFVSASLQDILQQLLSLHNSLVELPDKVAIQLNDTHPAIAIPELMRLLVDQYLLEWDNAWDITVRTFSYTNHTLMPEALETWPIWLMKKLLPRHMQIIYEINQRFLNQVMYRQPGDSQLLRRMSLIDESGERYVRMSHLAIVGSHKVNGVSEIHTQLMKSTIFADFNWFYPDKIINLTNGITPRRWLNLANEKLAELINSCIGSGWQRDLDRLEKLTAYAEDTAFQEQFRAAKLANKQRLAEIIKMRVGTIVNPDSLFDVHIKRIHEYKRQLLNLLHIIALYNRIRANPAESIVPRTVIFAGKAAPGYDMAKLIIKAINDVANIINNDPLVGNRLKVIFIPNYDVSTAGDIIPAAELSQQISTAGTEASGTGNMKLALNGALTIGTLDGANIEICQLVGEDNIFIFGLKTGEVEQLKRSGYRPQDYAEANPQLWQVLEMLGNGYFSQTEMDRFKPIVDSLLYHDLYCVLADFGSYIDCQRKVETLYQNPAEWNRKAILNVAHMGNFSSDRTIREYASKVWNVTPVVHD